MVGWDATDGKAQSARVRVTVPFVILEATMRSGAHRAMYAAESNLRAVLARDIVRTVP